MVKVEEQIRTYYWPDGTSTVFKDIVEFGMPGSTHRLKDKNGIFYIVAPGWRYIMLEGIESFTV